MEIVQHEIILKGRSNKLTEDEKIIQKQLEERYTQEETMWR